MRLGIYGWVQHDGGSLASGNYLLIRELLARGHEIDLFVEEGVSRPAFEESAFRVAPLPPRYVTTLADLGFPGSLVRGINLATMGAAVSRFGRAVMAEHRQRRYDAFAFLGMMSQWRLPGVPLLAWGQGAPGGESEALKALRWLIVDVSGWRRYALFGLTS